MSEYQTCIARPNKLEIQLGDKKRPYWRSTKDIGTVSSGTCQPSGFGWARGVMQNVDKAFRDVREARDSVES